MSVAPQEGAAGTRVALEALRAALLTGDLAPGQRLVEAELAASYGVSRASVRAALMDLAAEGVVERIPNRGARVRVVTVEEAVAIIECRMVLEGLCAAKAAERVDDEQVATLTALGERLRQDVAAGDPVAYSAHNRELHRLVREFSGQEVATGLLDRLNAQIVRHQFRLALRAGRPQVSLPEHLAIVEAIARRDPAAAERAARAHLVSVIAALQEPADG
ncbi:GntR family transcriptional regulator [Kineococcus sp. SYSU DK018]|uniref:GntR family transcriptional regulator n=1 Tax=Kineococcus sp. SYSU DK018 TaxID=3383139 RepID=UPI003D7D597D